MVCNKCGAVCDDQATVCSTCGAALAEAFELVEDPEVAKKNKIGMILGIVSIVISVITFILQWFCCIGWFTLLAGLILGVVSVVISKKKIWGIIGIAANVILGLILPLGIGFVIGLALASSY